MIHPAYSMTYNELVEGLSAEVAADNVAVTTNGPLVLYKYTQECVFGKKWNQFSLMARGLILDTVAKRVVATPFTKFFNYLERSDLLPDEPFEVTTKMDGSLGIIFFHNDRWHVATRGSFRSEQAVWAEEWLYRRIDLDVLVKGATYLVEIVYASNRIVISYGYEGLILLAGYSKQGNEYDRFTLTLISDLAGLKLVDVVQCSKLEDLLVVAKTLSGQKEGFVVRFSSGLRVKIKGDEYCRIHRLVSRVTPLAVWEMLEAQDNLEDVGKQLPEEFRRDFVQISMLLIAQYDALLREIMEAVKFTNLMDDKMLGLWLKDQIIYPQHAAKWIFNVRKKDILIEPLRRRVFEVFRPTGNRLEGYTPSNAMNRFSAEETS